MFFSVSGVFPCKTRCQNTEVLVELPGCCYVVAVELVFWVVARTMLGCC